MGRRGLKRARLVQFPTFSFKICDQSPPGSTASYIGAGHSWTCAVEVSRDLYCWGYNPSGNLGIGTTTDQHSPTLVSALSGSTVVSLSIGDGWHICATLDTGNLYCWGQNTYGSLGDGTTTDQDLPTLFSYQFPGGATIASITVGGHHTCAILTTGTLWCWGYNMYGQIGDNTIIDKHLPVQISLPTGTTVVYAMASNMATCAISNTGVLYCWGLNDHGQLGDGINTDQHTPSPVSVLIGSTVASIAGGDYHTCAILNSGALFCWGFNFFGQARGLLKHRIEHQCLAQL